MQFNNYYTILLTLATLTTTALSSPLNKIQSRNSQHAPLAKRSAHISCFTGDEGWVGTNGIEEFNKKACEHLVGKKGKHIGAKDTLEYTGEWDNEDVYVRILLTKAPLLITYEICIGDLTEMTDQCADSFWPWENDYMREGVISKYHGDAYLEIYLDVKE